MKPHLVVFSVMVECESDQQAIVHAVNGFMDGSVPLSYVEVTTPCENCGDVTCDDAPTTRHFLQLSDSHGVVTDLDHKIEKSHVN